MSSQAREFEADMVRRLIACGVRAERITVEYQDDIQDLAVTISEDVLPEHQSRTLFPVSTAADT